MKKIIRFFGRHFAQQKKFSCLFSEAVSEGIRETYEEMGYRFDARDHQEHQEKKDQDFKVFGK
jgi:hypothetical protein